VDAPAPEDPEVTPVELKAWLDSGKPVQLLDVREPAEDAICRIEGAVLIPLGSLTDRLDEVDRTRTVVVHCRSGVRSARAVAFLRQAGFARTYNLRGGILAWARDVDPTLATY
jgi:rhodanese-related sulfurtransferase